MLLLLIIRETEKLNSTSMSMFEVQDICPVLQWCYDNQVKLYVEL